MFGINDSNNQAGSAPQAIPQPPMPPNVPVNPISSQTHQEMPLQTHPPTATEQPSVGTVLDPLAAPAVSDDKLIELKQNALQNLAPLINHLEQTPEEKFKTTMMLIQASDNSALVTQAYEAANQIPDEKARAQALIDVVNEINYFTQKKSQQQ